MLRVWTDRQPAGYLDRHGSRGTAFVYEPKTVAARAVSITMPVRTASWDTQHGLTPIFDMNLPEGALRAHLMRSFAKATGTFDDLDLLAVVGRTQIGRIRYSDAEAELTEDVPFQSIDEILRAKRGGELFAYLLDKFAVHSGLSGIQPKVMIRAVDDAGATSGDRQSETFRSATHIVKFWDANVYPELAANEYFCLSTAKAMGLTVPDFQLSENGAAIVVQRFDLMPNGSYLGYEDFCVLNGVPTAEKYNGGYETRLFKRAREFIDPAEHRRAFEDLFKLFVLNCALRNGDAHLKNFGVIYEDVTGIARLAPVYDLVSTLPYIPKDGMALTLNGSTDWPDRKALTRLGQTRCDLSLQVINSTFEQAADILTALAPNVTRYFNDNTVHREIAGKLLTAWRTGIRDSLALAGTSG
jgi:serine/threonine-protein kinase HipA